MEESPCEARDNVSPWIPDCPKTQIRPQKPGQIEIEEFYGRKSQSIFDLIQETKEHNKNVKRSKVGFQVKKPFSD